VTERLYYRDTTLREFTARVVAVEQSHGRVVVVLDRTAFYPTSGGQPHDVGTLGSARVVDVVDAGESIHHVVEGEAPDVGATVVGTIDDGRRVDHTQQHTGQHVLSQAFERTESLHTVSFHLGTDTTTIDLDQPLLDVATVRAAEDLANKVVLEDRRVQIHFVAPEDVGQYGLRKLTSREGEIRIVDVEEFDRSACGGTHVGRTGQIGPIKIRRWERRGGTTRVEFLCGWRALRDHTNRIESTRALAERLSVADHEVRDAVARALDELERTRDELNRAQGSLLGLEVEKLLASAPPLDGRPDVRLVRQSFVDRAPDELKRLALRLVATRPSVVLLGSTGSRTHLLFARSDGVPYDVAQILRYVGPLVGARGGGTASLAQGGGSAIESVETALDAAVGLL
jgi:alanyl-tRNA synthetase